MTSRRLDISSLLCQENPSSAPPSSPILKPSLISEPVILAPHLRTNRDHPSAQSREHVPFSLQPASTRRYSPSPPTSRPTTRTGADRFPFLTDSIDFEHGSSSGVPRSIPSTASHHQTRLTDSGIKSTFGRPSSSHSQTVPCSPAIPYAPSFSFSNSSTIPITALHSRFSPLLTPSHHSFTSHDLVSPSLRPLQLPPKLSSRPPLPPTFFESQPQSQHTHRPSSSHSMPHSHSQSPLPLTGPGTSSSPQFRHQQLHHSRSTSNPISAGPSVVSLPPAHPAPAISGLDALVQAASDERRRISASLASSSTEDADWQRVNRRLRLSSQEQVMGSDDRHAHPQRELSRGPISVEGGRPFSNVPASIPSHLGEQGQRSHDRFSPEPSRSHGPRSATRESPSESLDRDVGPPLNWPENSRMLPTPADSWALQSQQPMGLDRGRTTHRSQAEERRTVLDGPGLPAQRASTITPTVSPPSRGRRQNSDGSRKTAAGAGLEAQQSQQRSPERIVLHEPYQMRRSAESMELDEPRPPPILFQPGQRPESRSISNRGSLHQWLPSREKLGDSPSMPNNVTELSHFERRPSSELVAISAHLLPPRRSLDDLRLDETPLAQLTRGREETEIQPIARVEEVSPDDTKIQSLTRHPLRTGERAQIDYQKPELKLSKSEEIQKEPQSATSEKPRSQRSMGIASLLSVDPLHPPSVIHQERASLLKMPRVVHVPEAPVTAQARPTEHRPPTADVLREMQLHLGPLMLPPSRQHPTSPRQQHGLRQHQRMSLEGLLSNPGELSPPPVNSKSTTDLLTPSKAVRRESRDWDTEKEERRESSKAEDSSYRGQQRSTITAPAELRVPEPTPAWDKGVEPSNTFPSPPPTAEVSHRRQSDPYLFPAQMHPDSAYTTSHHRHSSDPTRAGDVPPSKKRRLSGSEGEGSEHAEVSKPELKETPVMPLRRPGSAAEEKMSVRAEDVKVRTNVSGVDVLANEGHLEIWKSASESKVCRKLEAETKEGPAVEPRAASPRVPTPSETKKAREEFRRKSPDQVSTANSDPRSNAGKATHQKGKGHEQDPHEWLLEHYAGPSSQTLDSEHTAPLAASSPTSTKKRHRSATPEPLQSLEQELEHVIRSHAPDRHAMDVNADNDELLMELVSQTLEDTSSKMDVDVEDELLSLVDDRVHSPRVAVPPYRAPSNRPSSSSSAKNETSPSATVTATPPGSLGVSNAHRFGSPMVTTPVADRGSMPPPTSTSSASRKEPTPSETKPSANAASKKKKDAGAKPPPKPKAAAKPRAKPAPKSKLKPAEVPSGTNGPPKAKNAAAKKLPPNGQRSRSTSVMPGTRDSVGPDGDSKMDDKAEEEDGDLEDDKLYCVCKTKYDESRVMIACDRCDEWYHTQCVNMPDVEIDLVDQFICPLCIEHNPQLNLRTTYKKRCRRGLNHADPSSTDACHKPARGDFSKYCSDECGVKSMELRIDVWVNNGGKKETLWESVKNAEKREGVVVRAEVSVGSGATATADVTKTTKAERQIESCNSQLEDLVKAREQIKRDMDLVIWRGHLLELATQRAEDTNLCGWDQRLCFGEEEFQEFGVDVLESYDEVGGEEKAEDGMQVDGVEEQGEWWCVGEKVCPRHAGWQLLRGKEVAKEKEQKEQALLQLALGERAVRKRIEDILDPQNRNEASDISPKSPLKATNGNTLNGHSKSKPNGDASKKGKKRKAQQQP